MAFFKDKKYDRQFKGGIYFHHPGKCPRLDIIERITPTAPAEEQVSSNTANTCNADQLIKQVREADLIDPETKLPLSVMLEAAKKNPPKYIVANANPIEPSLNAPLLFLKAYLSEIISALSILKECFNSAQLLLSYPHTVSLDTKSFKAATIKTIPASEKYPQALSTCLIESLIHSGAVKNNTNSAAILTIDMQNLLNIHCLIKQPLLPAEQIVTIAGDGVANPAHYIAALDTPLIDLLNRAGLHDDTECIIEGSHLTGKIINPQTETITRKSTAYLAVRSYKERSPQPCIRCGWCIDDCPARLDPLWLYNKGIAGKSNSVSPKELSACFECGICSYICPSELPILNEIKKLKQAIIQNKS